MKFELYRQEDGNIYLLSPPTYFDLPPFCFYLTQVKSWIKSDWWISINNSVIFSQLNQIDKGFGWIIKDLCNLLICRNTRKINPLSLTKTDLMGLVEITDRLLALSDLPTPRESVKKDGINYEIDSTNDDYNDLVGDLLYQFGESGLTIAREYDLDSIRQIINRVNQWKHYENPDNYNKAKEDAEKEAIAPLMEKIMKARNENRLQYLSKEELEEKTKKKVFNWDEI